MYIKIPGNPSKKLCSLCILGSLESLDMFSFLLNILLRRTANMRSKWHGVSLHITFWHVRKPRSIRRVRVKKNERIKGMGRQKRSYLH